MKVYLVNPPYKQFRLQRDMRWNDVGRGGTAYYPVWLAYATGVLEQDGFQCRLVDAPANEWDSFETIADINNYGSDCVVIDTSFPSLKLDLAFVEELKSYYPRVKTIIVGAPAEPLKDKIMENKSVDFLARLEFDFVLRDLMNSLLYGRDGSEVKGVSYRDSHGIVYHNPNREWSTREDLDSIPFVSSVYKEHLNLKDYILNYSYALYPEVQIVTSRGCPARCTFCSWTENLTGRIYRHRSVGNVLDEFEYVKKEMPEVRQIFIEDDSFTINKKYVMEFCQGYQDRKLKMPWGCQTRIELDYETMVAMKKANCIHVDVGYESGSPDILRNIKKGITVEDIRRFANDAHKARLSVTGNWIIGLRGETKETIEDTRKLIKVTRADSLTVAVASPFPGTAMYDWVKENNYLIKDNYLDEFGHQQAIMSYPGLSDSEMKQAVDKILRDYFVSVSYIPIAMKRIMSKNGFNEAMVLGKSAVAFLKYLIKEKAL